MKTHDVLKLVPATIAVFAMAGCGRASEPLSAAQAASERREIPPITVYKSETCGCCKIWVEHLRSAGFKVEARDVDNLNSIKERVGVPYGKGSCHTAEVAGYFIEGHVPAADVKRLLETMPAAKGLTVPGMPVGSPGMEDGERRVPYDVLLVHQDGSTSVFAHHGD